MTIVEMYKYIHFVVIEEKPKTKVWSCRNNNSGTELGQVKWYGPWRQYCYFPTFNPPQFTVYNVSCFEDIIDFIRKVTEDRR